MQPNCAKHRNQTIQGNMNISCRHLTQNEDKVKEFRTFKTIEIYIPNKNKWNWTHIWFRRGINGKIYFAALVMLIDKIMLDNLGLVPNILFLASGYLKEEKLLSTILSPKISIEITTNNFCKSLWIWRIAKFRHNKKQRKRWKEDKNVFFF